MDKNSLTTVEQIEYYLGKDGFKDIYFKPTFPRAYEIEPTSVMPILTTGNAVKKYKLNLIFPELTFTINSYGYRSDFEFDVDTLKNKKLVICFGCTDTFGLQHDVDKIWPTLLQNNLGNEYTVLNCGVVGAALDTVARLVARICRVEGLTIDTMCILSPHPARREFVSKEYCHIINMLDKVYMPYPEYWDFIDWKSNNYNYHKNNLLIESMCQSHGIKIQNLTIDRFDKKAPWDYKGPFFALGENSQAAIGNYFTKKILNLPDLYNTMKS
jgi:hypothetical protein